MSKKINKKVEVKWKFEHDDKAIENNMGLTRKRFEELLLVLQDIFVEYVKEHENEDHIKGINKMFTIVIENIMNLNKLSETEKLILIFELGKFYNKEEEQIQREAILGAIVGQGNLGMLMNKITPEEIERHRKELGCDGDCVHCNREEKHREYVNKKMKEMREKHEHGADGMYM